MLDLIKIPFLGGICFAIALLLFYRFWVPPGVDREIYQMTRNENLLFSFIWYFAPGALITFIVQSWFWPIPYGLPLYVGVVLGSSVAIHQFLRITLGHHPKMRLRYDQSWIHAIPTAIGVFFLWCLPAWGLASFISWIF